MISSVYHACVDPPWQVQLTQAYDKPTVCTLDPLEQSACEDSFHAFDYFVNVFTTRPDAPSRNVVVTFTYPLSQCPSPLLAEVGSYPARRSELQSLRRGLQGQ